VSPAHPHGTKIDRGNGAKDHVVFYNGLAYPIRQDYTDGVGEAII